MKNNNNHSHVVTTGDGVDTTAHAAKDAVSIEKIDLIIEAYAHALDIGGWQQLTELDRDMQTVVEATVHATVHTANAGGVPAALQSKLQTLVELNQQAVELATGEREKVATQLQKLANAKAGAVEYASNAQLK